MTYREKYNARVTELKKRLPNYYGVLYKVEYPKDQMKDVYAVVNKSVINEEVLVKLEELFPK